MNEDTHPAGNAGAVTVSKPSRKEAITQGMGVGVAGGVGVAVDVGVGVGVPVGGRSSVIVVAVAALPRKGSP